MSLKQKFFKASIWNTVSQFSSQGINFIIIIILARVLAPKDFGLVGMVTVITAFLGYFTEWGLIASIIKKRDLDTLDCNTAFWSGIVFSVLLYGIAFWSAPLIAKFYDQPQLTLITRVICIDFLIRPFGFVHSALEAKALKYNILATAQLLSLFASGLIAVILALLGFGVWSLVFQVIAKSFFHSVTLIVLVNWKPGLMFSVERFKELIGFGVHVTANNVLKFVIENIDYLLVGKLLGPTSLGIYTLAFRLSRYPLEKMCGIFGRILFPTFAILQDDLKRLRKNMMRISLAGGLVITPFLVILLLGTKPLVTLSVGEKWLGAVPVIRIFTAYLFFSSVSFGDEPLMLAINKVKTLNCLKALTSVVLLVFGYIAIRNYGLIGMAITVTFVYVVYTVIVKRGILYHLKINVWEFLRDLKFVFLYTVTMFMLTGLYALCTYDKLNNLSYVSVEILIVGFLTILIIKKYRLVDFKKMEFNIDRIITVT